MSTAETRLIELRRRRRLVGVVLVLCLLASLAANVMASDAGLLAKVVGAWPPLILWFTVEMLGGGSPESSRATGRAAVLGATIAVAGLAAWLSYWHIVDLASMAGEDQWSHLLPLTVDLPAVVAAVRRSQLDRLIRDAESRQRPATPRTTTAAGPAPATHGDPVPATRSNRNNTTGRRGPRGHGPRVLAARAEHPEWTPAQIAEHVGCSIDTARKHLRANPTSRSPAPAGNGNRPEPTGEPESSDRPEPGGSEGPTDGESPLSDTRGFLPDKGDLVGVSTTSRTTTEALP